jgi:hypothetical protein
MSQKSDRTHHRPTPQHPEAHPAAKDEATVQGDRDDSRQFGNFYLKSAHCNDIFKGTGKLCCREIANCVASERVRSHRCEPKIHKSLKSLQPGVAM